MRAMDREGQVEQEKMHNKASDGGMPLALPFTHGLQVLYLFP